jgi:hypothetical protein
MTVRATPCHGRLPRDLPPESRASQSVFLLYRERVWFFYPNFNPSRLFQQVCYSFQFHYLRGIDVGSLLETCE